MRCRTQRTPRTAASRNSRGNEKMTPEQPLEKRGGEQPGRIQGDHRAAVVMQALEWIGGGFGLELRRHSADFLLCFAIWSFAAASTCAGVNPNFVRRSLSGADAPNVVMPILAPFVPT
jgi:hypothetical protein